MAFWLFRFLYRIITVPFKRIHEKKEYEKEVAEYNRLAAEKAEKEKQIVINKRLMNQKIEQKKY